ncbi:MAG: tetratricopeptide repeat protein [Bacteroidota bacterium]
MSGKKHRNISKSLQKNNSAKVAVKKTSEFSFPKWTIYAVLFITALLYAKSISNDFVSWDDDNYILNNPYLKDFSFSGIGQIFSNFYFGNYHPLTTLVYLFEYTWFGTTPLPYHLLNLLLHLLNIWLVYKLAEKLSGKNITSIVVAVLFAVHPMHVESVAWVSELKDILYTSSFLLSLWYYLKSESGNKYYFICLLFFVLSLLSKSAAVTLPVLLVLIDYYKGKKNNLKLLIKKIPFLLLSLLFGILAILSQKATESISDLTLSYSVIERIFLVSYAVIFYIVKMFIPVGLSAMHYYPDIQGGSLPWEYFASLPFLLLLAWLLLRRSTFSKELIFGAAFFIIVMSVMIQIVPVGFALTAERYSYVSYIGIFFIAGQWIVSLKKRQKLILTMFFLIAIIFSGITWARIAMWKNGITLFSDIIEKNPKAFHAYWIRGNMKNNNEDFQGALEDFNKSLEYNPRFVFGLINRADVKNKLFDYKGALADMNLAISLKADVSEAYNNRGMAYDGLGDTSLAMTDYNKAIEINPKLARAYNNRGVLKANTGDTVGALKDISKAIELEPDESDSYSNRGNLKAMKKDFKGSVEDYNFVLKLKPGDNMAYFNRGISHLYLNDTIAACEDWNNALKYGNKAASDVIKQYCK